jgi:excisionase family DNA binding protein
MAQDQAHAADVMLADGLLDVTEAAKFASVSRSFLYDLMEAGDLAYTKIGRRRLIPRRALVELARKGLVVREGVVEC